MIHPCVFLLVFNAFFCLYYYYHFLLQVLDEKGYKMSKSLGNVYNLAPCLPKIGRAHV